MCEILIMASNSSSENLDVSCVSGDGEISSTASDEKKNGSFQALVTRTSPTHSIQGTTRLGLKKLCQEKKAKKIKFFRNGDKFFKGLLYVLSLERIRSFDALLEDLTRVLVDQVNLSKGVRYIFSIDGKEKISYIEQLYEGESYVCSSNDHFIKLDYLNNEKPHWSVKTKPNENQTLKWEIVSNRESRDFIRPKLITIIRNGVKPRKAFRILLNKKTAYSFDQVLNDITDVIKLDSGAVRKIFTIGGRKVMSLIDFFADEDVFIAYGTEKYSTEDFTLDPEENKFVVHGVRNSGSFQKYNRKSGIFNNQLQSSRRRVSSPFVFSNVSASNSTIEDFNGSITQYLHSGSQTRDASQNNCSFSPSPIPSIITEKYDVGEIIGDGNFAVVYTCTNKEMDIEYALKVVDKTKCKGKEHLIESEVAILRRVKHPNIVQLIEDFDFENDLYLVMELVKGGDLFDAIVSVTKYTEKDARIMVHDLCSALCYLHSLNIVHRDIKPENLLVVEHSDGCRSLKLGDFGLAVEVNRPLFIVCGTPTYVAPEILAETGYGLKVDIWAAGVIMYILLCGFPPFRSHTNDQDELFDKILAGKYKFSKKSWKDVSETAKELITMMLKVNPDDRYSAAEVLEHPWVNTDIAGDIDMQSTISNEITMHFDHKHKSLKAPGISLIAITALDKIDKFFGMSHKSN